MALFASVNGTVLPAQEARISVLDNGFMFGDGVYETLRTYGGRPFHLDRHLQRLRASAARAGFAVPHGEAEWSRLVEEVLAAAANTESYIRLVVSRGVGDVSYRFERIAAPTVVILVKPYEPLPESAYAEGVDVVIPLTRRNHPRTVDPAMKSTSLLNNILAVQEAQRKKAFEPILLNLQGDVAEGAGSNVFVAKDGVVVTPPLSAGILPGITRQVVLERCAALGLRAEEARMAPDDLHGADEAFLTSTLKELVPIRSVDDRPVGTGRPGQITLRLLADFRAYARGGQAF